MARNPRLDLPGSGHPVMNRGTARRCLFESREDIRFFLSCLARAVRRGQIEVHAWSVLTTLASFKNPARIPSARQRQRPTCRPAVADSPLGRGSRPEPAGGERYDGRLYSPRLGSSDPETLRAVVGRRLAMPATTVLQGADLDHLVRAAPPPRHPCVNEPEFGLADGSRPGVPVASPESIREVIAERRREDSAWTIHTNREARCGWDVLEAGLLRGLSAATHREFGMLMSGSACSASRLHQQHRQLQEHDEKYSEVAAGIAREVLDRVV